MPDFENKPDFNDALNTLGANQGNASDQTISVNDPDRPKPKLRLKLMLIPSI